jgi:hypothetical protein
MISIIFAIIFISIIVFGFIKTRGNKNKSKSSSNVGGGYYIGFDHEQNPHDKSRHVDEIQAS